MSQLTQMIHKVRRFINGPLNPQQRKEEWERVHQPFELRYHQGKNYRWDDQWFHNHWTAIFGDFLGCSPDQFGSGNVLLDVGCGSRPVLVWFQGECERNYIDPLLAKYREIGQMAPYWAATPTENQLSLPAERFVPSLEGKCDFVNCWNVLDHTYDWRQILDNIRRYAKPGALVNLGTDFEAHGKGHPGIDDKDFFFQFVNEHFRVEAERAEFADREIALKLIKR